MYFLTISLYEPVNYNCVQAWYSLIVLKVQFIPDQSVFKLCTCPLVAATT